VIRFEQSSHALRAIGREAVIIAFIMGKYFLDSSVAQPDAQSRKFTLRPWRLERSGRLKKSE